MTQSKAKGKTAAAALLLAATLTVAAGCAKQPAPFTPDENEALSDTRFSRGFEVSAFHANESQGKPVGRLDYGGEAEKAEPLWRLAQWGCTHSLMDAALTKKDFRYEYRDAAKRVTVDRNSGKIGLSIDADTEYGGRVRQPNEDWPHLLLEQKKVNSGRLADLEKLYLEVEFTLTHFTDQMADADRKDYHTAQFQWFVTLQNTRPGSENFGRSMWFGLGFFDRRYEYPPSFAAQDGGKEDNTGMFIYIVDSKKYLTDPVRVGEKVRVRFNILPHVKSALNIAKQRNFLKETAFEDLELGSTNIGWEMTGNFSAGVEISKLSIMKVPKEAAQ